MAPPPLEEDQRLAPRSKSVLKERNKPHSIWWDKKRESSLYDPYDDGGSGNRGTQGANPIVRHRIVKRTVITKEEEQEEEEITVEEEASKETDEEKIQWYGESIYEEIRTLAKR